MKSQHYSHISSTCYTIQQHLDDIRELVKTGKSPGGALLTPLPKNEEERLLSQLSKISERVTELDKEFKYKEKHQARDGISVTRMWINILLRTCLELVEDLKPKHIRTRYGFMPEDRAKFLDSHVNQLMTGIKEILDSIE